MYDEIIKKGGEIALMYLEWRGKMKIDYPKIFGSEEVLKTQFHHAK